MNEKEKGRPTGPGAAPSNSNHDHPMSDLGTQSTSAVSSLVVDMDVVLENLERANGHRVPRPRRSVDPEKVLAFLEGVTQVAREIPAPRRSHGGAILDADGNDITGLITEYPVAVVPREFMGGPQPATRADLVVFAPGEDPERIQDAILQGQVMAQFLQRFEKDKGLPLVFRELHISSGDQTRVELALVGLPGAEALRVSRAFRDLEEEDKRAAELERLTRERELWHEADQAARERREAAKLAEAGGSLEPLNWTELFAEDYSKADFLPGKLLERGQQIALVGDGKAGKSLLVIDWCYRAVTGREFLEGPAGLEPIRVLYLDAENNRSDLWMRLRSLGARPDELEGLVYLSFPALNPLDTTAGAAQVMDLVAKYGPDAVVIDTVSRFISGKENDADTWLALYRNLHRALKAEGVAGVRLDHFGKEAEKGSRGSSAKSQDIDHVWELTAGVADQEVSEGVTTVRTPLRLKRTHTRTGLGPDSLDILRVGRKTDHEWVPGSTEHLVRAALDPFQVPEALVADAGLAARICEYLADHPDGTSTNQVVKNVDGRADDIRKALKELEASGNLATAAGKRGATNYRLARPFGGAS